MTPSKHPESQLSTPDWVADAVFYQIFPERFANGDASLDPQNVEAWDGTPTCDNFFGGDLAGITAHLDHIQGLGANALYLTPIFRAETNHRYDATDYFQVDERLGDLDAFRTFIAAAHDRGIRVVLDAVLNHCGIGHPAFQDVIARESESPHVNWFMVEDFPVESHPEPNYRTCSGCYYLPKWNVYNPEVREHHLRVARHWIAEGIDGWRLDVPYFINKSFWRRFRKEVKTIDDDLYIVAEEWRDPEEWLRGDTADGTMNYTLRDLVLAFTADRTHTAHEVAAGLNKLRDRTPRAARPAMLNLLGSHDTERLITRHRGDGDATRLALAVLYAAQGAPMLYYGDEIGVSGDNDPGCRAPMQWEPSKWDASTLEWTRQLGELRSEAPPLRRGAQHVIAVSDDVLVIQRDAAANGAAIVVINRHAAPATLQLRQLTGDGRVPGPIDGWTVRLGRASLIGAGAETTLRIPGTGAAFLRRPASTAGRQP